MLLNLCEEAVRPDYPETNSLRFSSNCVGARPARNFVLTICDAWGTLGHVALNVINPIETNENRVYTLY